MTDFLKSAIGPVLGLLGTIAVALLGYRQWKKQQDLARYGGFLSERQAAYKDLWQKLEAVHLSVRSEEFCEEQFHQLVRAVNTHLIHTDLYLDPAEKSRVGDYMVALGGLGRLLAQASETDAKAEAQRSLHDTESIPPEVLTQVHGLHQAYAEVEKTREILVAHFRKALGSELFR